MSQFKFFLLCVTFIQPSEAQRLSYVAVRSQSSYIYRPVFTKLLKKVNSKPRKCRLLSSDDSVKQQRSSLGWSVSHYETNRSNPRCLLYV